jgi:Protein of unknown function (DUF4058)
MAMIFPGMDPYLEEPQIWAGVHAALIIYMRDHLQPYLRPRYIAAVQERVFVEGPDREIIPDVCVAEEEGPVLVRVPPLEVHESYIEILDRLSGQRVVTVIELVSPTNKFAGPGRALYQTKQKEVLASQAHLVEIDLLRAGPHVLAVPEWAARGQANYAYLVSVNRSQALRDSYELYFCHLSHRLPRIQIPLADNDPDVRLDFQAVLEQAYEAGSYRARLNYQAPCKPPLSAEQQSWADRLIQAAPAPQ